MSSSVGRVRNEAPAREPDDFQEAAEPATAYSKNIRKII